MNGEVLILSRKILRFLPFKVNRASGSRRFYFVGKSGSSHIKNLEKIDGEKALESFIHTSSIYDLIVPSLRRASRLGWMQMRDISSPVRADRGLPSLSLLEIRIRERKATQYSNHFKRVLPIGRNELFILLEIDG